MIQTLLLGDIADIQTGPFGSQLHQEDYVDEGTPIITVEHLGGDRIMTQNLPRVSDDDKQRLSKYWMCEGDTIFSRVGSVDRASYVHQEEDGWLFSGRCLRVRPDVEKVNPRYLSFILRSPQFTSYIKSIAVGATMPSINTKLLLTAPVVLIPRDEQEKVADMLDAIERKIELNRQMNETLEQMGQALFRHYFIDNPEAEKWETSTIGEYYDVLLGGTPSRTKNEYWENGTVGWINSGKINEFRITEPSEFITEEALNSSAAKLLPVGTTVIAITGATLGQISRLEREFAANQSVIGMVPKDRIGNDFIYYWVTHSITKLIGHQTGGAQQHINRSNVVNFELPVPDDTVLKDFQERVKPISNQISNNCLEIQTLTTLRDTLLPRLISGKVKV